MKPLARFINRSVADTLFLRSRLCCYFDACGCVCTRKEQCVDQSLLVSVAYPHFFFFILLLLIILCCSRETKLRFWILVCVRFNSRTTSLPYASIQSSYVRAQDFCGLSRVVTTQPPARCNYFPRLPKERVYKGVLASRQKSSSKSQLLACIKASQNLQLHPLQVSSDGHYCVRNSLHRKSISR